MEIDRFHEVYESSFRDSRLTESAPDYHLIDIDSLRQVLRENNHLYADENIRGLFLISSISYGRLIPKTDTMGVL